MARGLLIKNSEMIIQGKISQGDLRVKDGIIETIAIGGGLNHRKDEDFIDGEGLYLLPGAIDPQVHFREPGQPEKEDISSGSRAAVAGGVTSFLDMPNNNPSAVTLESMNSKINSASKTAVNNYGFFIGATPDNVEDLQEAVGTPEAPLAVPGICGIKIFMGSSTGTLLVNERDALENIFSKTAGLIAVHAEDEKRLVSRYPDYENRTDVAAHAEWRDDITALLATQLSVELAQMYNHRLHVLHLTSGLEADWLNGITSLPSKAGEGAIITTETLPQHLTLTDVDVAEQGTRLQMNPPIRYQEDKDILWRRLTDGTIQCIATDHAPHPLEAKALGFPKAPSGMPGVETSLAVMLTHAKSGRCSIEQVAQWMSTNVADCFNMIGKGQIEVGFDADLVLVDMETVQQVKDENMWARVGWNPFNGHDLVGWAKVTIVAGVPVFERTEATGPKGRILVEKGTCGSPILMGPWK